MPVVPATQEAETGEWLEPGGRRFYSAEIAPVCFSLDDRAKLHLKKIIILININKFFIVRNLKSPLAGLVGVTDTGNSRDEKNRG